MPSRSQRSGSWKKWVAIFLCWTGFALFFTTQSYLVQARYVGRVDWRGTLVNWLLWSYSWNVVTPLVLRLADRFPLQRGKLRRSISVHLLAAPVLHVISTTVFILGQPLIVGPLFPDMRPRFESFRLLVISDVHSGLLVYWLIVAINQAIDYYRKYIDKELRASQLEARLVTAQLDALRMQLHPHFLFNTLNSVSVLMRRDIDTADRMLLQLSNLLRVTVAKNAAHEIELRQELDILEGYLEIERIRFQDRLTVRMHIDSSILDALVPLLFFQPLVENAIRHGIADREAGGVIDIRAERLNGLVRLEVRDDGPGLDTSRTEFVEGIGLSNTRSRLDHLYGPDGRLEVCNGEDGGLIVGATLPFHLERSSQTQTKE